MNKEGTDSHGVVRENRKLRKVKLGRMKVSALCQREFKQEWSDELVSKMDLDKLGTPELSERDGYFYIMDGQHRIEALKAWLGTGWEEQYLECWVATGLTEQDEAERFLSLNHRKNVDSFQKFKVSVRAGRQTETDIDRIVKQEGLAVSKLSTPGSVRCVSTLIKIYTRSSGDTLGRALSLARDSYGDAGMDAAVIDGFGLLCDRYNGAMDEKAAVKALSNAHGGVNGLLNAAQQLRQKTGNAKSHCVAAAAVTIINRQQSKKLPAWWKN